MKRIITLLLTLSMALSLAACSTQGKNTPPLEESHPEEAPAAVGAVGAAAPGDGESMAAMVTCPINMAPAKSNTYPYMGVTLELPEILLNGVLDNKIFMRSDEDVEYTDLNGSNMVPMGWRPSPENTVLHGGGVELLFVPEEMQSRTPRLGLENPVLYDEYLIWVEDTLPLAYVGMYLKSEFQEAMLNSKYTQHEKLGENNQYVYYLSYNLPTEAMSQEGKDFFAAVDSLKNGVSVFEAKPMDDTYFGLTTPDVSQISQVGTFQTTTLDGQPIDQSIFSGKKLTMVNAWTTWCGACIDEMPDLEALSQELKDTDAQIISIVCDTADARGEIEEELLALAQRITERTGVTFPCLIPDVNLKDGLLQGILGYPTTWFVDENGNIVGDAVLGSNSKENWMALIQERLAEVNG